MSSTSSSSRLVDGDFAHEQWLRPVEEDDSKPQPILCIADDDEVRSKRKLLIPNDEDSECQHRHCKRHRIDNFDTVFESTLCSSEIETKGQSIASQRQQAADCSLRYNNDLSTVNTINFPVATVQQLHYNDTPPTHDGYGFVEPRNLYNPKSLTDSGLEESSIHKSTSNLGLHPSTTELIDSNGSFEQICFGMIMHIRMESFNQVVLRELATTELRLVELDEYGVLRLQNSQQDVGVVGAQGRHVFNMLAQARLDWQLLYNIVEKTDMSKNRNGENVKKSLALYLSAILYGRASLFEHLGNFLQTERYYLQDPRNCDRNVPYRNPHRLDGMDLETVMTHDLHSEEPPSIARQEKADAPLDIFASIECDDTLEEIPEPPSLRTTLHSHQRQALSFMLRRERGWDLYGAHPDIWKQQTDITGHQTYINTVTQEPQDEPPFGFQGGLLADEMGLGKTLTMIALIAYDSHMQGTSAQVNHIDCSKSISSTLVVLPPALLQVWETELGRHLRQNTISWHKHHGRSRRKTYSNSRYDLVLTTYETVASEWKRLETTPFGLFSVHWRRLILDEAHYIRAPRANRTKAVCRLQAGSRWAVSGTPIQNSLQDLASLLRYLHLYPYAEKSVFDAHITDLWKTYAEEEAVARLKRLIQAITLRRTKKILDLPERFDTLRYLRFSPQEELFYQSAAAPIADMLDCTLSSGSTQYKLYQNALCQINELRMFCNLGLMMDNLQGNQIESTNPSFPVPSLKMDKNGAEDTFASTYTPSSQNSVDHSLLRESRGTDNSMPKSPRPPEVDNDYEMSEPQTLAINDCSSTQSPRQRVNESLHVASPNDDIAMSESIDMPDPTLEEDDFSTNHVLDIKLANMYGQVPIRESNVPTKIKRLITDLAELSPGVKSVVFSQWVSTLRLIGMILQQGHIPHLRYDGTQSLKDRARTLERFKTDPSVKIILVSITCGAVGLDLTAASQVFLMEPQWNPNVEEQALSRVHRMMQIKNVNTVRYIMEKSFEEHITKVQRRKNLLSELIMSQRTMSPCDLNRSRLQHLRSLLG